MKKAVIMVLCAAVAAAILAFIVTSSESFNTIDDVVSTSVTETTDNTITVKWDTVKKAKMYRVYYAADGEDYISAETENTKIKIPNLKQATHYSIYVNAVKKNFGKVIESSNHTEIKTCTVPEGGKITKITADDYSTVTVIWKENKSADGYQLSYGKGKSNSDKTVDIDGAQNTVKVIEGLAAATQYSVRVRTFVKDGDKKVYGEWSDDSSVTTEKEPTLPDNVDKKKKMVALTFDDGPGYNQSSDKILDVLEKHNARATFFMVGKNAKDMPDNLKRKVKLGCELGNHTMTHTRYGKQMKKSDIKKCSDAIYKACGKRPTAFRPPGGFTNKRIADECKKEKMAMYYWSMDTEDWDIPRSNDKTRKEVVADGKKLAKYIMKHVDDGDIILMHEIYDETAVAVSIVVPKLIKEGYQLVTCEELILAKTGKAPVPGVLYIDGERSNERGY
ncbi:MAG: polysaccharide deacetylase family protein [Eubacterium sp.]|nr:polysaccharide deacetylase family protein [Eubacterium sp.]MBR0412442.1 polysaccharide deacetylase family protein [Eubacterium sp.]